MADVLGQQPVYLRAVSEVGVLRGVLPLVRVRGLFGRYLISLPFLNSGGPLGDEEACNALVSRAISEARNSRCSLLELRTARDVPHSLRCSYRKVTVRLPLPRSEAELWATTFRSKLRSQIRRPMREGMHVRFGAGEIGAFYSVFARNMRQLGTPAMSRDFFEAVASAFPDNVGLATVYTSSGVPAAAGFCFFWKHECEVAWASSLRHLNPLAPNMLLYAALMEEAIRRGSRMFNFGRCTPGGTTHRFKKQWGGSDERLAWPFWCRTDELSSPFADRPTHRLAAAAWRRIPGGIADRWGPGLARQLPL